MCSLNKKYIVITAAILGITILLVSVSDLGLMSAIPTSHAQVPKGKVFVMYAASLIGTFEETLGPTFQERTGYIYDGEPRGSIQVANMITDELRKPDIFVSAGTIPIKKLMNNTPRLADWLVKFGSAEMVIHILPTADYFMTWRRQERQNYHGTTCCPDKISSLEELTQN